MTKFIIAGFCIIMSTACQTNARKKKANGDTTRTQSMTQTFAKPKVNIKTVGILLYDGYAALDAMGPYMVFNELMGTRVFFVGRHKGIIEDGRGLKVQVDSSIDDVKQLDILLVTGGLKETYQETQDSLLLSWIRHIDSSSTYTTSVCTGAWILGAAGLLRGKDATTHWYGKKRLGDDYGAKIQNTRYAHSGKYWTSAGVTAGMDMSLALINDIAGERYTKAAMLDLEYDPHPPFKGGSESNTDKELVATIRAMYDGGMEAALHPEKMFKNMQFDNAKDLVCGMPVSAGVMDTAHYHGKLFGFCSTGCKQVFLKTPEAYTTK